VCAQQTISLQVRDQTKRVFKVQLVKRGAARVAHPQAEVCCSVAPSHGCGTWLRRRAHSSTRTSKGRSWMASDVAEYSCRFVMSTCVRQ